MGTETELSRELKIAAKAAKMANSPTWAALMERAANALEVSAYIMREQDSVSWEWLEQYADGKGMQYASGFVWEARRAYKKEKK